MKKQLIVLLSIFISSSTFSQTEYVERYDNGQIKIKGFIKDSLFTGKYLEYFQNGNVKVEGEFKNCEYKTNYTKLTRNIFPVNINSGIIEGVKHGIWEYYYQNGVLSGKANFLCGLKQGSFFYYREDGKIRWIDFYSYDKKMGTHVFYESGLLSETKLYAYEYNKSNELESKLIIETEYYEDGSLKEKNIRKEVNGENQEKDYKEYYTNGFLKSEISSSNGIYRRFYQNGNIEIEMSLNGQFYKKFYENGNIQSKEYFKEDKPIGKQYYYDINGEITKIETWKDGKVVSVELKKAND
jgi:antitoxin component YwqK of YwqJK toxin-antitoxin module